jgi:hypothetical protein
MENKLVVERNVMLWAYENNAPQRVISKFAGRVYNHDSEEFRKRYSKGYTIYVVSHWP